MRRGHSNGKQLLRPFIVTFKMVRYEKVQAYDEEDAARRVKQGSAQLREIEIVDVEEDV